MENKTNRYIENVKDIAAISVREHAPWNIAVDMYDTEIGVQFEHEDNRTELRKEFYDYVELHKYDADGNEIG